MWPRSQTSRLPGGQDAPNGDVALTGIAPVVLSRTCLPTVPWRDGDVPSSSAGRSRLAATGPSIARRSDLSLAKPSRSLTLNPDWEAVDARLVPLHDV